MALGAQMLDRACGDALAWLGPDDADGPFVAVNLSPMQFLHDDLVTVVAAALDRSGLPAHRLQLEITETAILDCRHETIEQLDRIRGLGVDLGLDDFGTGYASLSHLRRLPLAFVKIDQSFVSGLGVDRDDERIVEAVIDLAAHFGLRSIAEGVETEHQLQRLVELGCDQVQGHFLARPLSAPEVPGCLARTW